MKRVCPVHLADESVTVFHMIGLIAWLCLLAFFLVCEYGVSTVGVGVILQNGCGIQR